MAAGAGVAWRIERGWGRPGGHAIRLPAAFRRQLWPLLGAYLILAHLAAAAILWQSSWPGHLAWKLGISSHWAEFSPSYRTQRAKLRRLARAVEPGAALFIGDSLLGSLDIGALADHAVQLSISGDTSRRVAARIADYARIPGTRLVLIHVGTNDLRFRPPAAIAEPLSRALGAIPAAMPVIVSAILPVDERVFRPYGNAQVAAANRVLARACAARPGCRFVDAGAVLADGTGNLDRRFHSPGDGLHLNAAGVRAWQQALAPVLAPWRGARDGPPAIAGAALPGSRG